MVIRHRKNYLPLTIGRNIAFSVFGIYHKFDITKTKHFIQ